MRTIHAKFHHSLPDALVELVSVLCSDDWVRYSTSNEEHFYYVVGHKASELDREDREDFSVLSVPIPFAIEPGHEAEVHARVAAERPRFVERATRRLQAAGVNREHVSLLLDVFGGKKIDPSELAGKFAFEKGSERWTAFGELLSAVLFERGLDEDNDPRSEAERRHEGAVATQKLYAQELARLFPNVVQRAGSLAPLDAVDPQLNEASRCYLYGFFRATVLLSAGALERCLRAATGVGDARPAKDEQGWLIGLVDQALAKGLLGSRTMPGHEPAFYDYARTVIRLRNKVAHEALNPDSSGALDALTKARQVVDFVLNQRRK